MFIVAPPKVAHGYCIRGLSQNHVRRLFAQSIGQQRSYAKDVAGVETEKERTKREMYAIMIF
jgi:hypothetical protein